MFSRGKEVLFVIVIGIILPGIIISLLQNTPTKDGVDNSNEIALSTEKKDNYNLNVLMRNGEIINLPMNTYLVSVVLREMPADFEIEALKAQAVVARTYVLRRFISGSKHDEAVICTDASCCQGYYDVESYLNDGGNEKDVEKVHAAVEETNNEVLIFNGELIDATYFSCSGGMTEDAVAVWGADVPYLQATASPGEEKAKYYIDTVKFSTTEFCNLLNIGKVENAGFIIEDITYTEGGGVDTIRICGKQFRGTEIRKKLKLRSTAFLLSVVGDTVTITTRGFGHRVGMSQYGAEAMAVKGSSYREILYHYYKGTQLIKHDNN